MVELAARHAVPIYAAREFVIGGGLMSYGTPQADGFRQVGIKLGLTIPPALLVRADHVIE